MNDAPLRPGGDYVLYWMIAARRMRFSPALERAVDLAEALDRPLLVFEPLRVDHRWASARTHHFVLAGMASNARRFDEAQIAYLPWVEREAGQGRGLLEALASRACTVVTDDAPVFFLPRAVAAAGRRLPVRLEAVDGWGVIPLADVPRAFPTAHGFRRFAHRRLPSLLVAPPQVDPLVSARRRAPADVPRPVLERWGQTSREHLTPSGRARLIRSLPVDHAVAEASVRGGEDAARARLGAFLDADLSRYGDGRNHPDDDASSGLSPWLHFGHLAAAEVTTAILAREGWHPGRVVSKAAGQRRGWWGLSEGAQAFLDELITWREVGAAFSWHRPDDADRFEGLPDWAQETLLQHADDPRPFVYDLDELAAGRTHDPLWNAAQRELVSEGRMHNYLRMLWGKKILHWTPDPRTAHAVMLELNNRYALDGRDPNSSSGIAWVLGRFDRAWGPERAVFGKVRYMSTESTLRKLRVRSYLERFAADAA